MEHDASHSRSLEARSVIDSSRAVSLQASVRLLSQGFPCIRSVSLPIRARPLFLWSCTLAMRAGLRMPSLRRPLGASYTLRAANSLGQ